MRIRLPSSLTNSGDRQSSKTLPSDDISCSSDDGSLASVKSSRSFLALSSRSRSRSRSRQVREEKNLNIANASTRANKKKQKSPTKTIMKRLQKSFASAPNTQVDRSLEQQKQKKTDCSQREADHEKENTVPSINTGSSEAATNADSVIDSAIVSIAERAVAVNFPSSYIKAVPIKREELVGSSPRTNVSQRPESKRGERRKTPENSTSSGKLKSREITKGSEEQQTNKTTKMGGDDLVVGKRKGGTMGDIPSDVYAEMDSAVHGDEEKKHSLISPISENTSDSLLPPLADDEEVNQKLLLPTIGQKGAGSGKSGTLAGENTSEEPPEDAIRGLQPRSHAKVGPKEPEKALSSPNGRETTISDPAAANANVWVSSPLSEGSGRESLDMSGDSSLSMVRSIVFDSDDDDSNDHITSLRKATFRPPREVVTIIAAPVVAMQTKTPFTATKSLRQQQQQNPERNEFDSIANEEEKIEDCRHPKGSNRRQDKSTRRRGRNEVEDDEKKTAQELAIKLVKDLEAMRIENERYESKNRRLETKLQILKAQQDEHLVHRGRLIKACLYTGPVFVLCGGLDVFLATILLVWVLVEIEGFLDGGEGHDEEDEGEDEDDDSEHEGDDLDDGSSMAL